MFSTQLHVSLSYGCREGERKTPTPQQIVIRSSSMAETYHDTDRVHSLPHDYVKLGNAGGSADIPSSTRSRTTPPLVVSLVGENARKMLWAIFTAFVALSYARLSDHVMCVP